MNVREALASASETKVYESGEGVIDLLPRILRDHFGGQAAIIVADENTLAAAGERVGQVITHGGGRVASVVTFPGKPILHAEYHHIESLRERLRPLEGVPVAVGGGTVNDLVKRASWELGRRYVCVATAASVDGYTSFGAAIVKDGFKQTLECDAPFATLGESEVLVRAPASMNAAGYGDLLAKVYAGADWVLADELAIHPIHPTAWRMVQEELRSWTADPAGVAHRNPHAISTLFSGLAVTGFAMQAIRDSRPASGAEHLLSHVWEMEGLEKDGESVSHGFKVALGSLGSCALYELLLDFDIESLDIDSLVRRSVSWETRKAEIELRIGKRPYAPQMIEQSRKKFVSGQDLRERLERLRARWNPLKRRLREQLIPYARSRDLLEQAGCPVRPEDIALTREHAVATFDLAQMMRQRYTALDAAYELGMLDEWKNRIAASDLYWR